MLKKHVEVVGAIFIDAQNKVFCTRRKHYGQLSLKWEFPGGKIEPGETQQEALKREILEELEADVKIFDHFLTVNHEYETFTITLHTFLCENNLESYKLNSHEEAEWVQRNNLLDLDWAEADLPIVYKLMEGR